MKKKQTKNYSKTLVNMKKKAIFFLKKYNNEKYSSPPDQNIKLIIPNLWPFANLIDFVINSSGPATKYFIFKFSVSDINACVKFGPILGIFEPTSLVTGEDSGRVRCLCRTFCNLISYNCYLTSTFTGRLVWVLISGQMSFPNHYIGFCD
jgi:hypothetical protein